MNKERIIVPICGIDVSCVGMDINGWNIEKVSKNDIDKVNIEGSKSLYSMLFELINTEDAVLGIPFFYNDLLSDYSDKYNTESRNANKYFIILSKTTDKPSEIIPVMNALRLCSSSQVGCWHPLVICNGMLQLAGVRSAYTYDALQNNVPMLQRTIIESNEFRRLLDALLYKKPSSVVQLMIAFFNEACRTTNHYLSYIMRITILEMLIGSNAELSYRIKRQIAVLLGKSKQESIEISERLQKMYAARSGFLHSGKYETITDEFMNLAFDYSRRVIANLIMIQDDIDTVRGTLDQAGYGANPYKVLY